MSTITRLVITGLTAAAVAVTGCSSAPGSRTAASSATHTGTSTLTQLVSELGRCVHDHGAPNFPDPYIDANGRVAFPPDSPDLPPAAQAACQHIINQLPAPGSSAPPVSQATFRKWLQFAACMRAHGLPAWPDPQPDGSFPLPRSLQAAPSSAIAPAFTTCRPLDPNPDGKYTISQANS